MVRPVWRSLVLAWLVVVMVATAVSPAPAAESLRKGDALKIVVFEEDSLSGLFSVSEAGEISFPLLGRLQVVNKTPQAIEEEIERLLEIDLIRDAEVAVSLADRVTLAVHVIGDVRNPGKVPFPENGGLDLTTAIASAGGLTETSDPARVTIRRNGQQGGGSVAEAGGQRLLLPGDTIIVGSKAKAETITILGEVKSPGSIELPNSGELDLLTAIARAGGFSPRARPSKVTVRRKTASGNTEAATVNASRMQKDGGDPYLLQPGDVVIVPESIF